MPSQRLLLLFPAAAGALLFVLPLSVLSQTSETKAKPTGTISGRVTVNEKPVADIMVMVHTADRPVQQPTARTKTDASGRYRVVGLAAGQYHVMAIAPALAVVEAGFSSSYYGSGKSVVLAAGEDVDEVDVQLVRGSVITGRVTDASRKPVIEERINIQMIDHAGNQVQQPVSGMWNYQMSQTDDRGIYRIYGLSAGRYRVSVGSNEGGIFSSRSRTYYPLTFYGDTNDAAKATVIELQEGTEATNIDIRVGRASKSFVVSGRVVDSENGQPIPGIRMMYGPNRPNQPFHGGYIGVATGSRGEFLLEGLEPGRYGVSVSATFDTASHYSDPLFFEIIDADLTNLELKATRGLTLSGALVFEGSRANELQQHIGLLRVGAATTSPNQQGQSSASSAIAPGGSFQILGVRPGKLRLYVGATSSALRGVTLLRVERGGVDVTQNLEIQPGESIIDLRLVASLGAGTIRGTIRFVGGVPPSNLRLYVSAKREGRFIGGGTLVDARGHFVITDLTSGTYDVEINTSYTGPPAGRQIPPQKQTIAVTEDRETRVDFIVDLTHNRP